LEADHGVKNDDLREKWLNIPYETRLIATQFIFRELCEHAKRSGTFRYLIYERLGFYRDAYSPLTFFMEGDFMCEPTNFRKERRTNDKQTSAA